VATLKILRRFNSERNLLNAIWTNSLMLQYTLK
jgi:hypothetical protein